MGTSTSPAFNADTLRRGLEGQSADGLMSLYADDAEVRIIDRNTQPSHPMVMNGRDQIQSMLNDVYSRDMTHKMEECIVQGDRAAYSESCLYPDGVRVLSESMIRLRDGKIVEQIMIQAWDE
ncbi:nuclear transport factor 2 family protein [Streptomyces sp. NPDC006458]|uniref:nuclear transport factor 2 family protein n=1 Tax=Streptomyces sp. NPDC006458 TaxID=3154302 RepID=UPI0033B3A130